MKSPSKILRIVLPAVLLIALGGYTIAQKDDGEEQPTKLRALHITGEGYHDYENQKRILTEGVAERIPGIEWTIWHHMSADEAREQMGVEGWAEGYDVVLYNICHAKETDKEFIESVVAVHEAGLPAVALHCTMHSYHWQIEAAEGEVKAWNRLLGVSSKGHGPKEPITVTIVPEKKDHPVLAGIPDGWTTPEGELYNVQHVYTADVLAYGENGVAEEPQAVIWTNESADAKVVGTTIGHHNSTMETDEYLDLVSNALLWVTEE